jgi:hypothetical protein
MHKSGTSLVAEMLHKSGVLMLDQSEERGQDTQNKFERLAFQQLNKDILGCGNTFSLDVVPPRRLLPSAQQYQAMAAAIGRCEAQQVDWGFKDPRTCLTYPVWKACLPQHTLVVVYRHPEQVTRHYTAKNALRVWKALRIWTIYNVRLLEIFPATPSPTVIINYERLMSDTAEFVRLSTHVGRPLVDARRTERYRQRSTESWQTLWVDRIMRGIGGQSPLQTYRALEALRAQQVKSLDTVLHPNRQPLSS